MMQRHKLRRRVRRVPLVPKRHVKYEGIMAATIYRYKRQLKFFFDYLRENDLALPSDVDDLDITVSEYINHIYQDDYPVNFGNDLVSGLKRFMPRCRKHLEISTSFMRNWNKALHRRRALPLPRDMLLAMVAVALIKDQPRLALALLVGFVGLLRSGEILALTKDMFGIHGNDKLLVLTLPETKSGHRRGEVEHVMVHDPLIIKFAVKVLGTMSDKEPLLGWSFRTLSACIVQLAGTFGCKDDSLTPYCIRRGGATWHFTTYQNYDTTQALGRWSSAKTARQYINMATSELGLLSLPPWGKLRMEKGVAAVSSLTEQWC